MLAQIRRRLPLISPQTLISCTYVAVTHPPVEPMMISPLGAGRGVLYIYLGPASKLSRSRAVARHARRRDRPNVQRSLGHLPIQKAKSSFFGFSELASRLFIASSFL